MFHIKLSCGIGSSVLLKIYAQINRIGKIIVHGVSSD